MKITEKYVARHFLIAQKALGQGELGDVFWSPGAEYPAHELTRVLRDIVPPLRILESLRPLRP